MGNKSSLMLQDDEIKQISGQTGLSPQQIEKLYSRFTQLDRDHCGSLSKNDLLSIPELAINPLCERLIEMFFLERGQELERINFRQFMRVLAAFRSGQQPAAAASPSSPAPAQLADDSDRSSSEEHSAGGGRPPGRPRAARVSRREPPSDGLTEKLYFVFKIYDNDNDGRVSFTDLRSILKLMVGSYIDEVQLDKIATRAFVEVDQDNDGFIEFAEFCKVFAGKDMEDKLRVKFC